MDKPPQTILITGTTKGIGNYLANYYLQKGVNVIGCGRSANNITHENFLYVRTDISDEDEVINLFKIIRRKYPVLDATINNAAINPKIALSIMTPLKTALEVMNTNFIGTFNVCKESAKLMARNGHGRLVNFSSMAVKHEVPGEALYASSKAAITTLTRVLAKEYYPLGITCNVIAPSAIKTTLMDAVDPKALVNVLSRNAVPHIGELEDISQTVDFLISPKNKSITGQVIYLGGA
jgi:3-oxoacyl-[acyl-carrier protein] reductase